jgi:Protein of unknown function (DUF3617)
MAMRLHAAAAALFAAAAMTNGVTGQAPTLTPGKYGATLQVSIDGESEPPEKDEQCLSKSDIDGLDQWLAKAHGADCDASDRKVDGGTLRFIVRCADDGEQTSTRGELVIRQDAFDAVLRRTDDTGAIKMESTFSIAARRTGDCTR